MSINRSLFKIVNIFIGGVLVATSLVSCKDSSEISLNKTSLKMKHNNANKIPKDFTYIVVKQPKFTANLQLSKIVNSVVQYNKNRSLPTDTLSVTLIDTQTNEKADYQGDLQQYPASIVKMFWLVAAYQRISQGQSKESELLPAIEPMIYKSENQAASKVIDVITNTKSTLEKLPEDKLSIYIRRRKELNTFFSKAGYSKNLNISQKIFPINNENVTNLNGFDRQLRGRNDEEPIENRLSTNDAARLMYEIVNAQSITPEISSKMKRMLTRNIDPSFWKKQPPNPIEFNPIESFFGQGLPESNTEKIVSKAGRTSRSRQEVAFIKSKDGKIQYILAVFGNDSVYGKSKYVFPEIASLVHKSMLAKEKKNESKSKDHKINNNISG
jgi:beta-lactamase class A